MKANVFILAQAQTQILEIPLSLAKADCAVGLRVFINPLKHRGKGGGCPQFVYFIVLNYNVKKFQQIV